MATNPSGEGEGGAKSWNEWKEHWDKMKAAEDELKALQKELSSTKGPKRQRPLKEKIDELLAAIKGHVKEMKQKWKNKWNTGPPQSSGH
jgi:hypothetical protein